MAKIEGQKPVFFDDKGLRSRFTSYIGLGVATIVTLLLAFFVVSVLINPFLPQIRLKPVAALPQQSDINFHPPELPILTKRETIAKQTGEKAKLEKKKREDARLQRAGAAEVLREAKIGPVSGAANEIGRAHV